LPIWNDHVSPVLDVAERLLIVDTEASGERTETRRLGRASLRETASTLRAMGLDVLICGALSGELARVLAGSGTTVVPWVTGRADEVVRAYVEGRIDEPQYVLPGCRRGPGVRRRRRRRGGGFGRGRR
jgi:predicted Fe-Mo cluster-binding NifX family protein